MPPKPMKDRLVMAAATRVMGRPFMVPGASQTSTRLRTPPNSHTASIKLTPDPTSQTGDSL